MVMVAAVEHVALLLSYWRGTRHKGGPSPRGGGRGRFTRETVDRHRQDWRWGCAVFLLLRRVPGSRSGSSLWGLRVSPWLYFEIRHQKWFTVEAVDVLQGVGRREATTAEL